MLNVVESADDLADLVKQAAEEVEAESLSEDSESVKDKVEIPGEADTSVTTIGSSEMPESPEPVEGSERASEVRLSMYQVDVSKDSVGTASETDIASENDGQSDSPPVKADSSASLSISENGDIARGDPGALASKLGQTVMAGETHLRAE